ncbi:MAG TPA: cistern family PEP-CTERM protein [Phenylobacterium sp.]
MARFAAAALTAALAFSAGAAQAAIELTFTAPGAQSVYINGFQPKAGTVVDPDIHSLLKLSLLNVSANGYQWNFGYDLSNTSTDTSRLTTIGWNVTEDFGGVTGTSGLFDRYATGGEMSSLGKLDLCLKSNSGGSCGGGGNGGLTSGASGTGLFSLTFASQSTSYVTKDVPVYNNKGKLIRTDHVSVPVVTVIAAPTSLTLNDFAAHYQALGGGGSTVGIGSIAPLPPPPPQKIALESIVPPSQQIERESLVAVPEPATWVMMITGFGFAGAMLRRQRSALAR